MFTSTQKYILGAGEKVEPVLGTYINWLPEFSFIELDRTGAYVSFFLLLLSK